MSYLQRVPPFLVVQSFRGFLGDPVRKQTAAIITDVLL